MYNLRLRKNNKKVMTRETAWYQPPGLIVEKLFDLFVISRWFVSVCKVKTIPVNGLYSDDDIKR